MPKKNLLWINEESRCVDLNNPFRVFKALKRNIEFSKYKCCECGTILTKLYAKNYKEEFYYKKKYYCGECHNSSNKSGVMFKPIFKCCATSRRASQWYMTSGSGHKLSKINRINHHKNCVNSRRFQILMKQARFVACVTLGNKVSPDLKKLIISEYL